MSELSIEDKAKRYDEAIKAAKSLCKITTSLPMKEYMESLFPELQESDDDRIINNIKKAVESYWSDEPLHEILAWLEKKSTPQVRTGLEWVNTIDDACDKRYAEEYAHGEYCHEQSFKWGFQEGVDWLEKQGNNMGISEATKKELEDNLNRALEKETQKSWNEFLEKQGEQKPNYCYHEVDLSGCSEEYRKAYYDGWNNYNQQHSQCKSELYDVVKCLINGMKFYYEDNEEATWGTDKWSMPVKHIIKVLEKQGSQILANSAKTCKDEQKSAWSEDDEYCLAGAIETELYMLDVVNGIKRFDVGNSSIKEECTRELAWLKSLKERIQPQNTWKPSDEQMNALNDVISSRDIRYDVLSELWKNLKKLKG